jgi:hypothetical protein
MREDDVASYELQKVQHITSFLLCARSWCGLPGSTESAWRWRVLLGSTEGSKYHILFIACGKMTPPPRKYRRFQISHPFYCMREDDTASQEVQKMQYITSFLLRARRWRDILGSTEGSRYHILSDACEKMTWPHRIYRRIEISSHFFCVQKDDMASQEVQKVRDITSFLSHARRWHGLLGGTECAWYHIIFCVHENDAASQEVQKVPDITSFLLLAERWCGLLGSTEGSRYHILFIACGKMTWPPMNCRRCMISHPFFACMKLTWPPRKYRRFEISHPFIACGKMTWPSRNYRRCQISRPFYCLWEDDTASYEVEKVPDITTFLLHRGRWCGLLGSTEGSRYNILLLRAERWRVLLRTTEGSRYHILSFACM